MLCMGNVVHVSVSLTVHKSPASDVTGEVMRQHLARVRKVGNSHVAVVIHRISQFHESNIISNKQKITKGKKI